MNFQDMIQTLNRYWANEGCVIRQGYDLEVGAGTFNPATFLASLGPEPCKTAYVEPCRRPTDGRYGENPNRLQHYYQYQTILKPSPDNIQDLYLESLRVLGLDVDKHDIRFVHDDWESPTLGASGLGWEVWLDGMEITQFTYFQQVGGVALKPITGEITYGLERIATYIQKVDSVFDITWVDGVTYRDIHHHSEREFSQYNFEIANTEFNSQAFGAYELEAKRCLEKKLVLPAYDMVMKASHVFNMLDARGAISVTERMGYILRIRELASLVAVEYIETRRILNFPLLKNKTDMAHTVKPTGGSAVLVDDEVAFNAGEMVPFVCEIGCEELPATFVPKGMNSFKSLLEKFLTDEKIEFSGMAVWGTPRRVTVYIEKLQAGKAAQEDVKKGPPLNLAYDETGILSKMGVGYAKKTNISLPAKSELLENPAGSAVFVQEFQGKPFVFSRIKTEAISTAKLLTENLPGMVAKIDYPKKMRWGEGDFEYARPIRWILCLLDRRVLSFKVGNVTSGSITYGHPVFAKEAVQVLSANDYVSVLAERKVIVDPEARKSLILNELDKITADTWQIPYQQKVLAEVLFLVEYPFLVLTEFPDRFLTVPKELLISEMVEHQKYFAITKKNGDLINRFVITANNQPSATIEDGNRKVLVARLSDGEFMFLADQKIRLLDRLDQLKEMTFIKGLGSMADKVDRIKQHVKVLLNYVPCDESLANMTAQLCKSDLTSKVVYEFPELQGVMGKYYAKIQNQPDDVAQGIEEHYWPLGSKEQLPQSQTGIIVSLADKIDNLLACFGTGKIPGASSDPFALRRQTLGIIRMVIEHKLRIPIFVVLESCLSNFAGLTTRKHEAVVADLRRFFIKRIETVFTNYALAPDEIAASLTQEFADIYDLFERINALREFRKGDAFANLCGVYKRCNNLLNKNQELSELDETLFEKDAEKAIFAKLREIEPLIAALMKKQLYYDSYTKLAEIWPYLDRLFDVGSGVKIMDDDPVLRKNRLALLRQITSFFAILLDFSKIAIAK